MDKKSDYNIEKTLLAFVTDSESEAILKDIPFKDFGIKSKIIKGSTTAAHSYLKKNDSPDLLIIDLSDEKLPISEIEKISEVCEPSVNVITIGENNDISVFRQLLALGVSDYLVKPLNTSLVVTRLKDVLQKGSEKIEKAGFAYSGHIISFLGVCGGVGSTTLATNCAISMAEDHKKHISLVDFSLTSGNISYLLDIPVNAGLLDILKDPKRVDQTILDKVMIPYGNRLDILSSESEVLTPYSHCAPGMKSTLGLLAQHYNYTLVDCSHSAPAAFKDLVFQFSDTVVLVCELTFTAARETARLIRYFKNISNVEQKVLVLANKSGQYAKGEISQNNFEEAIDHPLTAIIDFDKKTPLECLNDATPLVREEGPLKDDLKAFSSHLTGRAQVQKEKSFLKNLFTS